ncbi:C-type lectin domain family 2 member D-like [Terrapene carolina triunguis]|uniref:C-type lectin domain family 2 member D-like n=1 Tax=Terrapene triunguis TaxID=2587831 RepID=UPI00115638BF|nr:C-type lectin domain family 2 member D-like [Terrapene carolina triunguis]
MPAVTHLLAQTCLAAEGSAWVPPAPAKPPPASRTAEPRRPIAAWGARCRLGRRGRGATAGGTAAGIASQYLVHPGSAVVPSPNPPSGPWCPDGWVGYRGKCYYFSKAKENWNNSQSNCSALGASLAVIDSEQEMTFLLRYKGKLDHWLGLWRKQDQDQPWKWANGTEFNNQFEVRGGGACAYLNDVGVSSSSCETEKNWICAKPDQYGKRKENSVEGMDKQ